MMTKDKAASALLAYMLSGPSAPKDKGVSRALIAETPATFTWLREISSVESIIISDAELAEAILAATGHHLASSTRCTGGALSVSSKVSVKESPDTVYVVQLRHHGSVSSMDAFMALGTKPVDAHILPMPAVCPVPDAKERQEATGMGRQITQFIPVIGVPSIYPQLPYD
ncbi:hypothetical protein BJX76DRAFT_356123 [Aspergillus varians]